MEFKFNSDIKYSRKFKNKNIDLITHKIVVNSDGENFMVAFPNVFKKYILPKVSSDDLVQQWNTNWLKFWQNQLNFAVFCATSGCGVDYENHMQSKGLLGSLYNFHVYYQIRRILKEISVALPQEQSWNAFDNSYDRAAYERLCQEFNVSPHTDWRQKEFPNSNGLGDVHTTSHTAWTQTDFRHHNAYKHVVSKNVGNLDLTKMTFGPEVPGGRHCGVSSCYNLPPKKVHIDFISQDSDVEQVWSTFILDSSKGFTRAGVERINESIRTYCWAILGAQSGTRTGILGTGTAFDAQKQFLANVEDAINSPVNLPSQITRYQNTLKYAKSKVDFVYGIGLYMSPSNMELQIGTIQDYNNKIVIATEQQQIGLNGDVNDVPVPPKITETVLEKRHKVTVIPTKPKITPTKITPTPKNEEHEDNKTSLIIGSVLVGSALIYFFR